MTRRLLVLLLGSALLLAGLVSAREPAPDGGEPPLRLKKKRRPGETPPKAETPRPGTKDGTKTPPKGEKAKEDEPLDPEDGTPGAPEEDEKELLARVARNMRSVEEQLANRELGERTRQKQRDILRDLDRLINQAQRPPDQDNQQDQDQSPSAGGKDDKGGKQAKSGGRRGSGKQMTRAGRQSGKRNSGRRMTRTNPRPTGSQPRGKSAGTPGGAAGNRGGSGAKGTEREKDPNADLYKRFWGDKPESIRPSMDTFSNPQPFLPRYDDLIKKYSRTIAEKGRKKGD